MARKTTLPSFSVARRAIFEANQVDPANALNLHQQLAQGLQKLAKLYEIKTAGKTDDQVGNEILTQYFTHQKANQDKRGSSAMP